MESLGASGREQRYEHQVASRTESTNSLLSELHDGATVKPRFENVVRNAKRIQRFDHDPAFHRGGGAYDMVGFML